MKNREHYVNDGLEELFKIRFRRAVPGFAVIFAALGFIDSVSTPENLQFFMIIRMGTVLLLLLLLALSRKYSHRGIFFHRFLAYAGIITAAAVTSIMVIGSGGELYPFYTGMTFTGFFFIGFILSDMKDSLLGSLAAFLVFLLPLFLFGGESVQPAGMVIPLALVITVFGSAVYYNRMNRAHLVHELGSRFELENNQELLKEKVTERTEDLVQSYDILKESEKKFRTLFHHASDSIFLHEINEEMIIADANISACRAHGYARKELVGNPLSLLEGSSIGEKLPERREKLLAGETVTYEIQHVRKDGTRFPVEVSAQLVKISGRDFILSIDRDITERKKMEDQLVHKSLYDSLTGLPNRILFMDRLKTNFARRKRQSDILFSLLFIDIDHFKKINDSYGHLFGDEILVDVVDRLKGSIRPGDTLSRFGGDEFLLILEDLGKEEDAISIIERIQEGMKNPFRIGTVDIYVTLSIGITFSNIEYHHPEDMLRDTDNAMYHAKEQGRACYVVFDRKMHHSSIEALKLENDLRKAVIRNEFVLHYQPVVDINSLRITGYEALIRWEHPVYGMLYPESFIGIAESTGLISEIGKWALYEACNQIARWKKMFPDSDLVVSVNLSVKQFNFKLPDLITEVIKETGIEPENLRLEITESIMMEDINHAHVILSRLKEMNVRIYVDDFGTGYSSLNYIHKFPIDALKIDKSFIENIMNDEESLEVVRAVSTIAQNLNLNLIAEGIENEEQLEIIRSLNCNLTQGFHFGIPLDSKMSEKHMHEFAARYK